MARTHRFKSKASTADVLVQHLVDRHDTVVSNDLCPHPPGPSFLLNLEDAARNRIRVRHYSAPSEAHSPILQIDFEPGGQGLDLVCRFLESDAHFSPMEALAEDEERKKDNREFVLDLVLLDYDSLVVRPFAWVYRRLAALFVWASHRRGTTVFGHKLLAFARQTADWRPDEVTD